MWHTQLNGGQISVHVAHQRLRCRGHVAKPTQINRWNGCSLIKLGVLYMEPFISALGHLAAQTSPKKSYLNAT